MISKLIYSKMVSIDAGKKRNINKYIIQNCIFTMLNLFFFSHQVNKIKNKNQLFYYYYYIKSYLLMHTQIYFTIKVFFFPDAVAVWKGVILSGILPDKICTHKDNHMHII